VHWLQRLDVGRFLLVQIVCIGAVMGLRRYAARLMSSGERTMALGFDMVFTSKDRANDLLASGQALQSRAETIEWLSWAPAVAMFAIAWMWFGGRSRRREPAFGLRDED
jgi:hypothetical protein